MQSFRELGRDIFGGEFGRQLGGAGVAPLVFLLRDDFTTDEAAPLASPRTAEPGPGTLTQTDTGSQVSIVSGRKVVAGKTADFTDPLGYYESRARLAGRTLFSRYKIGASGGYRVGWNGANNIAPQTHGWLLSNDLNLYRINNNGLLSVADIALDTDYTLAIALRETGAHYLQKVGADWKLVWVSDTLTTSPLYPGDAVHNNTGTASIDYQRVLDLPAPFSTDYGIATQRLAGAQSAGQTFVHEANCVLEFVVTTLSSGSDIHVNFRYLDTNNRWRVSIDSAGTFYLSEFTAGVGTVRATASTVVSAGHRIVIVAEGSVIRGYSNNVLRWTYSSASAGDSNTNGNINSLGTGGIVSDIISWPHTLAGAAAALLDAAVA